MRPIRARTQISALLHTWLLLDFFGDGRRAGNEQGSSLTTTVMWQSLLSFAFAALLYPDVGPVPFAAANLCLSTLLIAIGSLGDEERPLRQLADASLLACAPVTRSTVVLARTGHAAFQLVLVTAGMALPPSILLAHLTGSVLLCPGYVLAACACSGLANGGLATLRATLTRVLGAARATLAMGSVKALLLGAGFVLFALGLRQLDGSADQLPIGRLGVELLPPYHAARVLAAPAQELWRVGLWAAVAALLLLANVALTRADAPPRARVARHPLLRRLLTGLAGRGPRLGIADFVATSMWRSPGFRARVLPLLGLPMGMVFLTLGGERTEDDFVLVCLLLQLPAIYLPFLVAFLPRADQAGSGWVFQQAPGIDGPLISDATWRALTSHVLVPVHGLAFALLLGIGPDRADRAAAGLFSLGLAVLAAERMAKLDRVPFTDDRDEDRGLDLGALFAGAIVLGGLGTAFGAALEPWARWPAAGLMLAAAAARLARRPRIGSGASEPVADRPIATTTAPPENTESEAERPKPSVSRELRAVVVLYVVLCVLPWAVGAAFAP